MSEKLQRYGMYLAVSMAVLVTLAAVGFYMINRPHRSFHQASQVAPQTALQAATSEQFKITTAFRNPSTDNGEQLRTTKKDSNGIVRELDINYKNGKQASIVRDSKGNITKLRLKLADGRVIEGKPSSDGQSISDASMSTPGGTPLVDLKTLANGDVEINGYQSDGKSLRYTEAISGDASTWKFFQADGKTLMLAEQRHGAARPWLKLYDKSGALLYSETAADNSAKFGSFMAFQGVVYGADGKATHNVILSEGPFDNGGGYVKSIDELSSNGTVKSTVTLDRQTKDLHAIGVFTSQQELIRAKRQAWTNVNSAALSAGEMTYELGQLLTQK